MNKTRLALLLYIMAAPVIAGSAVTAVLTMPNSTTMMLIWAALAGFAVAVPVALLVANALSGTKGG
ncbi:MAG: hypothetical protein WBO55_20030 [Rhizobiaceae bacterium]